MIVHRHEDRISNTATPVINLAIVINWRHDESYVLIEPNEFFEKDKPIEIVWEDDKGKEAGSFSFENGNKQSQFVFAFKRFMKKL